MSDIILYIYDHCYLTFECLILEKAQGWGLDLKVESEAQKKLGDVSIDWTLFGRHEQVSTVCFWHLV